MAMDCLLIDVGNSSIKWAVGDSCQPLTALDVQRCPRRSHQATADESDAQVLLNDLDLHNISVLPVWVSSVAGQPFDSQLIHCFQAAGWPSVMIESAKGCEHDVVNSYAQPQSMGVDRWLAMVAARYGRSGPLLVIDAGTALTIDVVAADGCHQGGYILPGVQLMEEALIRETGRVRFSDTALLSTEPGQSTAQCVTSGLWIAAFGAVSLVANRHPDHRIVLTGGGGEALLAVGVRGEWRPHLVLEGLAIRASVEFEG